MMIAQSNMEGFRFALCALQLVGIHARPRPEELSVPVATHVLGLGSGSAPAAAETGAAADAIIPSRPWACVTIRLFIHHYYN